MPTHPDRELQLIHYLSPLIAAIGFILVCSLLREPRRRNFSAVMIAGAGAAYLNGGLGIWEFAYTPFVTFCAYKGIQDYRWIGVGWLLHTGWDMVHHFFGTPIVPFVPTSSAGCALCDIGIALWYFADAPSLFERFGKRRAVPSALEG